jgi:hypothetical protein
MQQRYPCPKCGVPVGYGSRFCSNCGNTLPASSQPSPSPGSQYPGQPQSWGPQPQPYQPQQWGQQQQQSYNQQSGWGQYPPYNQVPGRQGPIPFQQQNTNSQPGYKAQKKPFSSNLIYLMIACIIVIAIGGIALATNGTFFSSAEPAAETPPTTTPTTPPATPPATTPEPPPTPPPPPPKYPASTFTPITAAELLAAYSSDSIAAREKYEGKEYAISGTISESNSSVPPSLYMKDGTTSTVEIQFNFSQGKEAMISEINPGDKVKVEARIGIFNGTILIVNNCKLVQ